MEFQDLDQFITERNRSFETMIRTAFRDRGYSREWVIKNADKIHVDEYPSNNTYIYSVEGKELFSVTYHMKLEQRDGHHKIYSEYSLTHL